MVSLGAVSELSHLKWIKRWVRDRGQGAFGLTPTLSVVGSPRCPEEMA